VSGRAGCARSLSFTPPLSPKTEFEVRRWLVWYFEDGRWKRCAAAMPEGAAASYADIERRYAEAISMEAV
jgi:hypothetical protein